MRVHLVPPDAGLQEKPLSKQSNISHIFYRLSNPLRMYTGGIQRKFLSKTLYRQLWFLPTWDVHIFAHEKRNRLMRQLVAKGRREGRTQCRYAVPAMHATKMRPLTSDQKTEEGGGGEWRQISIMTFANFLLRGSVVRRSFTVVTRVTRYMCQL